MSTKGPSKSFKATSIGSPKKKGKTSTPAFPAVLFHLREQTVRESNKYGQSSVKEPHTAWKVITNKDGSAVSALLMLRKNHVRATSYLRAGNTYALPGITFLCIYLPFLSSYFVFEFVKYAYLLPSIT